ncbi:TolB protein [Nitrosomonas nitrosa]|jgi:TolB protein|uniref:Tol-Pal system protein TolB n=1 Tax=Nitrosomonas nitrosa TaxID=52442 RepID=A0A1I4S4N1_9PROT|nr:Tol-Pal system beta propeller repeat protein TolB [Nitrosomonas nitrosa]MCO6434357.1 Tol-Pal system protein TolB [Nitrosomonas nitrosa]PTQ94429.1 TolB protein [Nitrosomonas nitrosa]CAE6497868.1 Protein TolB [Nitrosomonas nitrosa]SFM59213.1 TolB protein [Nitrosomonas nitrosa]HNP50374.1 Tol-Pal system beta propeller repeat protein TolB [Nitrosomonas nitrosa]
MQNFLSRFTCYVFFLFLSMAYSSLNAALNIEIFGGGATRIPIAIVPFSAESKLPQSVTAVVAADLERTGLFRMIDSLGHTPHEPEEIIYADWQNRGASALVIGNTTVLPDGRVDVRFRLMDVAKRTQLVGFAGTVSVEQLRAVAHRIADIVYETLTGDIGVFSTRIAFVLKQGNKYALQVADSDGFNAQSVIEYTEPIISPAWSPDGSKLAYVSFENKKPVVYVQTLSTRERKAVANFKGSNSAPAWSPDGSKLAVVLTMHGGSQIFLMNADGSGLQRLAQSSGIDTEPNFSPDGRSIIFTSDRGGSPQIYRMAISGERAGVAERLTFEGSYNVSPRHSPDGKSFAYIHRNGGRFNIAVQDFARRQVQLLTDSRFDESPSFAPNGKMILYASEINGRGILSVVSSDGQTKQRLSSQIGDIREPVWGPLLKSQRIGNYVN